ncbi:hypothetical protein GCM10023147_13160 [Tsukamurella soli]|uniref:Uncharacterized protein n=1 Tax=Tsukamurella soli TaxID=644556 RepID=A0ABP8JB11_9ACTN
MAAVINQRNAIAPSPVPEPTNSASGTMAAGLSRIHRPTGTRCGTVIGARGDHRDGKEKDTIAVCNSCYGLSR